MLRRLFVALVALVLAVSVLTVSPAGAANTASESLSDHDNNAATARVRAFGGANRYATSVAIAEAFVAGGGSGGFVESVIVASGESLIDAAAAAGLAASESAPVLLTPPSRLSRTVENFIVDEFISEVFIVGGTSVIPQSVEDALNALAPVRTVTRVAGADRYGTAVAVANEIGSPGVYCDSGLVTALLVNVDSSFADVIAVGPLAYALGLPILLTRAGALPASVAGYLADAEIERVVVVGGTAAVSAAVVADVNEAGVDDVVRISGANRYDTALEIRQAISDCDTVSLSPTTVALVNGAAAADGVSAGPLLGVGLDNDGVTPVLLVDSDGLPSDTRNFLRGLPTRSADASFVDLSITAIGGSAVVPDAVVQAAIAAATTSSPITATVTARVGSDTITVVFSAPVNGVTSGEAGFTTSALNRVHYRVSGGPLLLGDSLALSNGNRTLTITMADDSKLKEGTAISVADGTIKGQGADNRRVVGAQVAVRALPADRVRPNIDIFAPQGSHAIRISVTEPNLATAVASATERNVLLERIQVAGAALYVANAAAERNVAAVLPSSTNTDITICLFGLDDAVCEDTAPTGAAALAAALAVGETVTIASGAFVDDRGNESRSTSQRVTSYSNYPRVTRATVTSPVTLDIGPAAAPAPQVALWRWQRYDSASVATNVLTIAARPDGAAGGAPGNRWRVLWIGGTPATADTDTDPEVSVSVNKARETVLVSFDDDATIFSVVTALSADSGFAELFTVNSAVFANLLLANEKITDNLTASATSVATCAAVPAADTTECGQPNTSTPWTLRGGVSVVVVTLSYSETLSSFDYASLVAANQAGAKFPSAQRTASGTRARQLVGWQADPFTAELDLDDEFSFLLTTSSPSFADLPKSGDTISLPTALGTTFAPTDCSGGLSANSDSDPCGQSIAVDTPGQTLRRGSISGRIQGAETTVEPPVITATIDATAFLVTVVFSVPVDRETAEDTANYQIGNRPDDDGVIAPGENPLPEGTTVELSADRRTVTVTFPVGEENELVDRQRFIVSNAIRADGADDDDVTVDTTEIAVVIPTPTTIAVQEIRAEIDALTFTVTFAEAVNDADATDAANFATSARNPANYQITLDGESAGPLPAGSTIGALTANDEGVANTVATITLPAGNELADLTVITVVGGMITTADGDLTVATASFTVLEQITTEIEASVRSLTITVTFGEIVNTNRDGAGARNPANYQINGAGLPEDTTVELSARVVSLANRRVIITLPVGSELAGDDIITVIDGAINSPTTGRTVAAFAFTVQNAITGEVRAYTGFNHFTVTFSAPVDDTPNPGNSGTQAEIAAFAKSALNRANYVVQGSAGGGAGVGVGLSPDGLTATIALPVAVVNSQEYGVRGGSNLIAAADGGDLRAERRVVQAVSPPDITATINAEPGRSEFTVTFTEAVDLSSAENIQNYRIDGVQLGGTVGSTETASYDPDPANGLYVVTISNLPPAKELAIGQEVSINADTIDAATPTPPTSHSTSPTPVDSRSVVATSVTVEASTTPITATIAAVAGELEITVAFSAPVNGAAEGEANFASSAANPANYQINDADLPAGTTIALSASLTTEPNRVATITLPGTDALSAGDEINIVANRITAEFAETTRTVQPLDTSFAVVAETITATFEHVMAGFTNIVIDFSAPVSGAAPPADPANPTQTEIDAGATSSALNPANYQVGGTPLTGTSTITLTAGPAGPNTRVTIILPAGLGANEAVEVIGNVIRGADTDTRLVAGNTNPGTDVQQIVTTIARGDQSNIITVAFSNPDGSPAPVNPADAVDRLNYDVAGATLPAAAATLEISRGNTFVTITITQIDQLPFVLAEVYVRGGMIRSAFSSEDTRLVPETSPRFQWPALDPLTAEITAEVGTRIITVTFSDAVNDAVDGDSDFGSSALNRSAYRVDPDGPNGPLDSAGDPLKTAAQPVGDFALSDDRRVLTITLTPGQNNLGVPDVLAANARIALVGGRVRAQFDDRMVSTSGTNITFDIPEPPPGIGTTIAAVANTRVITVNFDAQVASPGDPSNTGFGGSARNPAHYLLERAGSGSAVSLDTLGVTANNIAVANTGASASDLDGSTVVTITLPGAVDVLAGGDIISIVDDNIRGNLGPSDGLKAEGDPFTVPAPPQPLTVELTAYTGCHIFKVAFSEAPNVAEDGDSGFATSAVNILAYRAGGVDGILGGTSINNADGVPVAIRHALLAYESSTFTVTVSLFQSAPSATLNPHPGFRPSTFATLIGGRVSSAADSNRSWGGKSAPRGGARMEFTGMPPGTACTVDDVLALP